MTDRLREEELEEQDGEELPEREVMSLLTTDPVVELPSPGPPLDAPDEEA